jgi:DNA-binding transcriptional MerR regulator
MSYKATPEQEAAQEGLQRQAEAALSTLAPIAQAATERLQAVAAELERLDTEPLGLNSAQRQTLRKTAQRLRTWAEAESEPLPVGYLTRAQFARLAQVSANTLVKWHAAGSLVPAYTHPLTHYRYYKPEQVAQVRSARQRRQRKVAK